MKKLWKVTGKVEASFYGTEEEVYRCQDDILVEVIRREGCTSQYEEITEKNEYEWYPFTLDENGKLEYTELDEASIFENLNKFEKVKEILLKNGYDLDENFVEDLTKAFEEVEND